MEGVATELSYEKLVRVHEGKKAWCSGEILAEYKELSGEWMGMSLETETTSSRDTFSKMRES